MNISQDFEYEMLWRINVNQDCDSRKSKAYGAASKPPLIPLYGGV